MRWETIEAREAQYAPFPEGLAPEIAEVLRGQGIEQLYTHQAEAFRRSMAGEHLVVVTPTASGKTLCYNLPVLQRLIERPQARALYLFPTKALSHDQYHGLHAVTQQLGREIKVYTFDGDTPASARRAIRAAGQIVVTNPDMLHAGILPNHTKWIQLFENLETVVIDELHQYRGVFGSHVANVIRRLRRICRFYGSDPRFVCCSATVANPDGMARTLLGGPVGVIDNNGAPRGKRVMVFYNPPVCEPRAGDSREQRERDAADRDAVYRARLADDRVRAVAYPGGDPDEVPAAGDGSAGRGHGAHPGISGGVSAQ